MCVRRMYVSFFWFTVAVGCLVPAGILASMGGRGWRWLANDPTYSLWCLLLLPLAVASFSCHFDETVLRAALRDPNWGLALCGLAAFGIIGIGIVTWEDVTDPRRPAPPYYFSGRANEQLDQLHQYIFSFNQSNNQTENKGKPAADIDKERRALREEYDALARAGGEKTVVYSILAAADCWNAGFVVFVIWYLIAQRAITRGRLDLLNNRHLLFIAVILSLWFPFRAYSEWFIRFGSLAALAEYQVMIVCGALLIIGVSVMVLSSWASSKNLIRALRLAGAALVGLISYLVAIKPDIVTFVFGVVRNIYLGTRIILGLMVFGAAAAVFLLIHEASTAEPEASTAEPEPGDHGVA
jgi:hypothetical protein